MNDYELVSVPYWTIDDTDGNTVGGSKDERLANAVASAWTERQEKGYPFKVKRGSLSERVKIPTARAKKGTT